MNSDRDRLLSDILAEPGHSGDPRDALLTRTLRHVKRQRTIRRVSGAGSVLLLLLPIVLLWRLHLPQVPEAINRKDSYVLVRTAPLPQSALIETQPLASSKLVASAPSLSVASIATRSEDREYSEIDDATLLALAGTNAAVLVRSGPHSAELVFASGTITPHSTD